MPSAFRAPLPRTRKVRPLGVPAGILSVTGAPPRVGILTSAPSAASSKETGTSIVRLSPLRPKTRCGETLHGDVEVAGRAAVVAGTALSAQPDLLAVLDPGRGSAPGSSARTCPGRCRRRSGTARRRPAGARRTSGRSRSSRTRRPPTPPRTPRPRTRDRCAAWCRACRRCPEQSGQAASLVSRSDRVTPSMASVKLIVADVSASGPFAGRRACCRRARRRRGRRTCRRSRRRRRARGAGRRG